MKNVEKQTAQPNEVVIIDEKKPQRRSRAVGYKGPELILWVMIAMLLVKFAIILFGEGK